MTDDDRLSLDEARWQQVIARKKYIDAPGFVYAVRSTGIYCRPGCASRQPNRSNVSFFNTPKQAQQAGYRPCKRCRTDAEPGQDSHLPLIEQACHKIHQSKDMPDLKQLSQAAGMSPTYFQRLFKAVIGVSPRQYGAEYRRQRLQANLQQSTSVTEAIYEAGFNASSRLYENTDRLLGMKPIEYRSGGAGITVTYALAASVLGPVLIAATPKGICGIDLDDNPATLIKRLQARFPKARLQEGGEAFSAWVSDVLACIEQPGRSLNLPLDIRGTAFQCRVWQALQNIPPGQTVTYTQLAAKIGQPKASRAVAKACATNHIAIIVPCHRVIAKDGSLRGYRWGIERKQALLEKESSIPKPVE